MNLRLSSLLILLALLMSGCVLILPSTHHSSASGIIEGKVVHQNGRPASAVEIDAIYQRGWTTFYPPVPNAFIVGTATTDKDGSFKIITTKRVDELVAHTQPRSKILGVKNSGNIIVVKP